MKVRQCHFAISVITANIHIRPRVIPSHDSTIARSGPAIDVLVITRHRAGFKMLANHRPKVYNRKV